MWWWCGSIKDEVKYDDEDDGKTIDGIAGSGSELEHCEDDGEGGSGLCGRRCCSLSPLRSRSLSLCFFFLCDFSALLRSFFRISISSDFAFFADDVDDDDVPADGVRCSPSRCRFDGV